LKTIFLSELTKELKKKFTSIIVDIDKPIKNTRHGIFLQVLECESERTTSKAVYSVCNK